MKKSRSIKIRAAPKWNGSGSLALELAQLDSSAIRGGCQSVCDKRMALMLILLFLTTATDTNQNSQCYKRWSGHRLNNCY